MKAKDFIKVLRAVIREEVRNAVRHELTQVLTENKKSLSKPSIQQQPKKFTGNSVLDQVLNETRLTSDFRQSSNVGYDDFGSFDTSNINHEPVSLIDIEPTDSYESPLPEMSSTLPFMKDYSQLMKKADQISTQKQF